MKTITRLFILITFISLSAFASAQSFTIAELVDLAPNGEEHFKTVVTGKGYTADNSATDNTTGGMTNELAYTHSGNAKIIYITPNFESDVRIISWEFNAPAVYNELKKELAGNRYQLKNVENRKGGKYISNFYSRPDVDVILTCDKTVNPNGNYIVSVKYTNIAKYIAK